MTCLQIGPAEALSAEPSVKGEVACELVLTVFNDEMGFCTYECRCNPKPMSVLLTVWGVQIWRQM